MRIEIITSRPHAAVENRANCHVLNKNGVFRSRAVRDQLLRVQVSYGHAPQTCFY